MIDKQTFDALTDYHTAAVGEQCEKETAELAETGRVLRDAEEPADRPRAVRRRGPIPHYVSRWYAECIPCGWAVDAKSREDAYDLAHDHDERHHDEPPPVIGCNCFPEVHGRIEYSPEDCPLHKGDPR